MDFWKNLFKAKLATNEQVWSHRWLCPFCGAKLPTRKARQCFSCGQDWHDSDKPARDAEAATLVSGQEDQEANGPPGKHLGAKAAGAPKADVTEERLLTFIATQPHIYEETAFSPDAFELLFFGLGHSDPTVRAQCCDLLGRAKSREREVMQRLLPLLQDEDPWVRRRACAIISLFAFRKIGTPRADPLLMALLADEDAETRRLAICALVNLRAYEALPAIRKHLEDPNDSVRRAAEEAIPWLT